MTRENIVKGGIGERIATWIKTTRIQTAMVTALALWIGYISVAPLTLETTIVLGVIGILVHIWGFTLNEVEDYKYDMAHGDMKGHPIAKGEISHVSARKLAWVAAALSIITALAFTSNQLATAVLMSSFIPGYLYDKYSKEHWWSNGYLSIWSMLMVLTGALFAGTPTLITAIIGLAVGIQIFVQVIEGDLKDLKGSESSFAKRCGVEVEKKPELIVENLNLDEKHEEWINHTVQFGVIVYGLKLIEVIAVWAVVWLSANTINSIDYIWTTIVFILVLMFLSTQSMFMLQTYDRDKIKKWSSAHELTSILLLGAAVFRLDPQGAILIAILPIVWYIGTNTLLHSGALNPDI